MCACIGAYTRQQACLLHACLHTLIASDDDLFNLALWYRETRWSHVHMTTNLLSRSFARNRQNAIHSTYPHPMAHRSSYQRNSLHLPIYSSQYTRIRSLRTAAHRGTRAYPSVESGRLAIYRFPLEGFTSTLHLHLPWLAGRSPAISGQILVCYTCTHILTTCMYAHSRMTCTHTPARSVF